MASDQQDIARQVTQGSMYGVLASVITVVLGFIRTTLLLRLLFPEDFGTNALALLYINMVFVLFSFGYNSAFIHHTDANEIVRKTYFTLRMGSSLIGLIILVMLIPIIGNIYPDDPLLVSVMYVYVIIFSLKSYNASQITFLSKQMGFRAIAIMAVSSSISMTIVAPTMAWLGWGIWSLVADQLSGILTQFFLLTFVYRPWRPRVGMDRQTARWFWEYGKNVWMSSNINFLLNRFDDWYVGTFLGSAALGYYSRAYEYAGYPRRVIANPIIAVFFPTFAHLQGDRRRLSRAFFRAMSLMLRSGGLFSLIFILTAPEFIPLLLGEKWLPMTTTFQLMIIYTLLNPLSMGARNLLMATGFPQIVMRTRIVQGLVFVPAVFAFGSFLDIEGVALAADLMVFVGAVILFYKTTQVVDYSHKALWLWPLVAVLLTAGLVLSLTPIWEEMNLWVSWISKTVLITVVYGGVLWLTEREQINVGRIMIWGIISPMIKERRQRK